MLKIEFVFGLTPTGTVVKQDYDNGKVLVDYALWSAMEKKQRLYILEHEEASCAAYQRWLEKQMRHAGNYSMGAEKLKASLTANERKLADTLERMEDKVWTPEFSDDGVHWQPVLTAYAGCEAELDEPFGAVNLDDEVDYKQAFEEAEAQLNKYREIVTRIQEAWRVSFSWESFGDTAKPMVAELLELLHREQNGVAPDTARMSVPDSDEEIDWQAQGRVDPKAPEVPVVDFRGIPEPVEDHVIRAWDEKTQQVVYWHHDRGWRPDLKGAKRFTRVRALEIVNSGNNVWPSYHVVNICAVSI